MATKPTLKIGATGKDVKELQSNLNNRGYNLAVDGIFGKNTLSAVKSFQEANKLEVDGIVGNNTWGSLSNTINPSTSTNNTNATTATPTKNYSNVDLSKYDSGFQASDAYNSALNKKTEAENAVSNYGDFEYSQKDLYDAVMDKIFNREKFSYDLNGDALYQQYKDKYIQQGKMAMQDTMGQAAAMTGGYGNSYAATAGNQAYQAQLQNLNDVIPELYQMAYDKYNQEGQALYNQYAMLSDEKNMEYSQWGDKYNQLLTERDYQGNEANNLYNKEYGEFTDAYNRDYNQYWNETNYGYQKDRDAVADSQWQAQFDEAKRQYDEQSALTKEQWEWQKAQAEKSASSGGGSSSSGSTSSNFEKATFSRIDDNGNYVFYIDGKERTYAAGVNPYTGTTNKDIKNGTFSNGYQPNNVNGNKLSKSGITDVVNGVTQNVWKTPDGKLWIWDGTQNKYLEYEE